jgi:type II secretory pathway pseudopilin PulG
VNTSEKIALAALVVPTLFSIIAVWRTRGAEATAASAELRAVRAERRADEALAVANRQAAALEAQRDEQAKLASSVARLGPHAIRWEIENGGGRVWILVNAGSERADGVYLTETYPLAYDLPDRVSLEPGSAYRFLMEGELANVRVHCDGEPEGRLVRLPAHR